ncbi:MAG: hypothetical protein FWC23_05645 [Chitinispirillia bacterium]|nr:hypothetical protein [Chitinispirillia bacterium]MCL2268651.1 hypothetical protein [Chitinispirillia bacterium]
MERHLLLISALIALIPAYTSAQNSDGSGITVTRELTGILTSVPEAEASYCHKFKIPFLRGGSPFTVGNNAEVALRGILAPTAVNAAAEAALTPAAFFQLTAGARAGSGWNIKFFGDYVYAIGIHHADSAGRPATDGGPFDGLITKSWAGAALQFDLAAVIPGDWNHVVARSYHEINYTHYTRAGKDDSWWQFEFDYGENRNGPNYYGNLLIGYQMPAFFKMAGLLAEGHLFLTGPKGREAWGDDRVRWTFSLLTQFALRENIDLAALVQTRAMRNFINDNAEDIYYQYRILDTSAPISLRFFRVVAAVTHKL